MASESSAKAGSNVFRGKATSPSPALRAESRNEDREDGRSGVVGRDVRVRELERLSVDSGISVAILCAARVSACVREVPCFVLWVGHWRDKKQADRVGVGTIVGK